MIKYKNINPYQIKIPCEELIGCFSFGSHLQPEDLVHICSLTWLAGESVKPFPLDPVSPYYFLLMFVKWRWKTEDIKMNVEWLKLCGAATVILSEATRGRDSNKFDKDSNKTRVKQSCKSLRRNHTKSNSHKKVKIRSLCGLFSTLLLD